jgi:hypothetical protein
LLGALRFVHSGSGPSFAESLPTGRAANGMELAEHRRVGKRLDRLSVATLAEQHRADDDAVAVLHVVRSSSEIPVALRLRNP